MKRFTSLFVIMLLSISISAQVHHFKSEYLAIKVENNEWTDWEETEVLIVVNLNEDKMTIYSKERQDFSIVEEIESKTKQEYKSTRLLAVDKDGLQCHVEIVYYNDSKLVIYIRYLDVQIAYQIKNS